MTTDLIKNRIAILDETYKDFVLSDFSTIQAELIVKKYSLSETSISVVENGVMLYLLLFIDKYELMRYLTYECNISIIQSITAVRTIVSKLPEEMISVTEEARAALTKTDSQIAKQHYLQALDTGSETQLYLYLLASKSPPLPKDIGQHLNEGQKEKYILIIGDIILGFYNIEDTEPLLIQELGISPDVAEPLAAEVQEFLAPLSDPTWQPPAIESDETPMPTESEPAVAKAQSATPTETAPPNTETVTPAPDSPTEAQLSNAVPSELQQSISELEKQFTETPSLRTMAHDMETARSTRQPAFEPIPDHQEVPTYTSNQVAPAETTQSPASEEPLQTTNRWQ